MRIVVNDIAASRGGAMTVLKQFYHHIRRVETENEWIFLLGDHYLEETDNIRVIVRQDVKNSWLKKIWFDCFAGRRFIDELKPDVVVSLQNIITFGVKAPQIVYVHQSIPFQNTKRFSFLKKRERVTAFYQHIIGGFIKASVKRADSVIVQTAWMKEAVAQKTHVSSDKILTAFPDVSSPPLNERAPFEKNRFFYPTNNEIYKNIDAIIQACTLLNEQGDTDFEVTLTLPQGTIHHRNIACIGSVPYDNMAHYYTSSTLLFPSYIETVGLPLLEAASLSGLILSADCAFAREVLGDYENVRFFDPFSPKELALLMKEVLSGNLYSKDCTVYEHTSDWDRVYRCILQKSI